MFICLFVCNRRRATSIENKNGVSEMMMKTKTKTTESNAKRTTDKNKYFSMTMAHKCPIEFPCLCRTWCRPCNLLDALSSTIQSFTCCCFFTIIYYYCNFHLLTSSSFDSTKKEEKNVMMIFIIIQSLFFWPKVIFSLLIFTTMFIEIYSANFYAVAYVGIHWPNIYDAYIGILTRKTNKRN